MAQPAVVPAVMGVWSSFRAPEAALDGPPTASGAVTGVVLASAGAGDDGAPGSPLVSLRAPLPGGHARVALISPDAAWAVAEDAPPADAAPAPPAPPPGAAARAAASRVQRASKRAGRAADRLAPEGAGVTPAGQALFHALATNFPEAEWDGARIVLAPGQLALEPPYGEADAVVLARTPAERKVVETIVLPRARDALAYAHAAAARAAAARAAGAPAVAAAASPTR